MATPNTTIYSSPAGSYFFGPDGICHVIDPAYVGEAYLVPQRVGGMVFFVLSVVLNVGSLLAYFLRRNTSYLSKRSDFMLLVLSALGGQLMCLIGLRAYWGWDNWPCRANLIFFLIIPALMAPLVIRVVAATNRVVYYEQAGNCSMEELDSTMQTLRASSPLFALPKMRAVFIKRLRGKAVTPLEMTMAKMVLFSSVLVYVTASPFIIVIVYYLVTLDVYKYNCFGCTFSYEDEWTFAGASFLLITFFSILLYRSRHSRDPLGELAELRISIVIIGVFGFFGVLFSLLNVANDEFSGQFSYEYVVGIGVMLVQVNQVVIPVLRTCKRFDPDIDGLRKLLADPALRSEFEQFTKRELSFENLRFLAEVDAFKADFDSDEPALRLTKALRIFNNMIVERSILQVNIDAKQRTTVEQAFHYSRDGDNNVITDIDVHVFDEAYDEIVHLIERDSFPRFKTYLRRKREDAERRGSKWALHASAVREGGDGEA
jgi:hypothetical protein